METSAPDFINEDEFNKTGSTLKMDLSIPFLSDCRNSIGMFQSLKSLFFPNKTYKYTH